MLTRPMDAMDREGCPIHNKASFSPDDLQRMRGGHCTNCGQCIYAGSGREWARLVRLPCPSCGRAW